MTNVNPIRILIADDHPMVRTGLRMFLMTSDDLTLAGEAGNGLEAVKLTEQLKPDIILMDLIMPHMDGLHATVEIHQRFPQVKIIALTSFTEPALIHEAMEAGVSGLLFKNATPNELANAIRSVYAGNTVFSPEVTRMVVNFSSSSEIPIIPLTEREKEVLRLMVIGKSNAQISEELILSLSTIKFHVSNILGKLNARNRGEVISKAIKSHLVDLQE